MSTDQSGLIATVRNANLAATQRVHDLKVQPPYFDALFDGSKTFEVRRNDRAYQAGDVVRLREYGRHDQGLQCPPCDHRATPCEGCHKRDSEGHYTGRELTRTISFVYSGDPRFGGIEPGHVVLALGALS